MTRTQAFQRGIDLLIANGGTTTGAFQFAAYASGGFILPAAFTGTGISFQVSIDETTYVGLYDSAGALLSIAVAQGRAYSFPVEIFAFPWGKLVSNGAEGGARIIQLSLKY